MKQVEKSSGALL